MAEKNETQSRRSAKQKMLTTLYRYIWVFALCCVVGFAVETLWCLIRHGYIESRKSLVWGPLSVAYGMGGVLLTLVCDRLVGSPLWKVFLISFAVGTAAEYICSLGQEIVFHSVAWDYSDVPLNINGRVCLLYSVFWGVLGVGWVKWILPLTNKLTEWIPLRVNHVLVWAFVAFFVVDAAVSAIAGIRMDQRKAGKPADNAIAAFFDEHFDDEKMHRIYANSKDV